MSETISHRCWAMIGLMIYPSFKCRCAEMVKERNLSAFATHTQHAQKGRLTVLFIKHEKIYRFYTNLEIV